MIVHNHARDIQTQGMDVNQSLKSDCELQRAKIQSLEERIVHLQTRVEKYEKHCSNLEKHLDVLVSTVLKHNNETAKELEIIVAPSSNAKPRN